MRPITVPFFRFSFSINNVLSFKKTAVNRYNSIIHDFYDKNKSNFLGW